MKTLDTLVSHLQHNSAVDAVFLTGSRGVGASTQSSDIDLVIILEKNPENIRSVYEIIDGAFADIFFFEKSELEKLLEASTVSANSPLEAGILVSWILKSEVLFDKSGILTKLKVHAPKILPTIPEYEKLDILQRVSYNLFQNNRYFLSKNSTYHEALEVRLLYSVVECVSAFLALRDRPWRGEKDAVAYIKEVSPGFYTDFLSFNTATDLNAKMAAYKSLALKTTPPGTTLFDYAIPVPLSKGPTSYDTLEDLRRFWANLSQGV